MKKNLLFILLFLIPILGVSQSVEFGFPQKDTNRYVKFVGLDKFDSISLKLSSLSISEYFGFKTKVSNDGFSINKYFTQGVTFVDANLLLSNVYNDTVTVYITNHPLVVDDGFVRGISLPDYSTVLVDGRREDLINTIIHELGHVLGLHHCENIKCVMSEDNEYDTSIKFCEHCLKEINN